ncbi:Gfo/Idh/MocA family protein [Brachybacterium saurashtrense]|uniref:Gfo/Idh/MocA family oxidoreductase n=1 Tax=Brachybacterium saurashtrense TaxID=556288 RepID=A0A345YMW6_9MICO|nr:Gfo/Idh/MocA family oxidoreductase [Brachybacterium saurashtrense]AXK45268.1 gfo/Idh/MocA family oxidoreductase [Brachybacterium saurashtrense]RRR21977.1 gfo/Idh/MocA family oxidoreductase [Brachybacterium saurashtrense]
MSAYSAAAVHADPATPPPPVPVVVIGAGGMGRAWIATVLGNAAARLVGVADVLDGAAEAAVAEVVPEKLRDAIVTGTDSLEVARRAGAEAVIDVTVPAAHHAVTADALHAGLPVLGEKPCAATLAEAVSLAGHAEATGRLFMVSQSRRNNPHLREARRLADELGGAGIVDTRFYKAPRFGGFRDAMEQPLLVDMAIHAVDAGRVLVEGTPVAVNATSHNPSWSWYAGDAAASAVITYDTGAVHTYSGSWCSPGAETSWNGDWSLSCAEGSVHWDGETPPTAHPAAGGAVAGRVPGDSDRWELDASLTDFCAALRGGDRPDSEVHDNVWTQAIVEAAVRSAASGARVQLAELLDEALHAARILDSADGRSRALERWKTGVSGLLAG